MNQFEEDGFSLYVEETMENLLEMREQHLQSLRELGYHYYDKPDLRWNRFIKRLQGRYFISKAAWCEIVDQLVEKADHEEVERMKRQWS